VQLPFFVTNNQNKQSPIVQAPNQILTSKTVSSIQSSSISGNIGDSTARVSGDFVPTDFKTLGVNIWKGVGFEPGFTLDI
jgi:hypothetical protein